MRTHLRLVVEGEEALQESEDGGDGGRGYAVIPDVEEAAFFACGSDLFCDGFFLVEGAGDVANVDCGDGGEAGGC